MLEIFLSKREILELYMNRVYLGAGIYGVETMSQKTCCGKPASELTLAEAALVAGIIRAPASFSPWNHLDAARRRSFVVLQRMREEGKITADQEQHARAAAAAHPAAAGRDGGAARVRQGISAAAVPEHLRRRQSARLEGAHDVSSRPFRMRQRPQSAMACGVFGRRVCRRRWSRWIRTPATCSRWSAARISRSHRSIARYAAGGSLDRLSSRLCMPPRSSEDCRRYR